MTDRDAEMICWCFSHTRGDIARDARQNRRSLILEKIMAAKRLGACRCAAENPKGTWCLADVRRVLDELTASQPWRSKDIVS